MNSLKSLTIVVVLAAVAYGAYVTLNGRPQSDSTAENAPPAWQGAPPQVSMGMQATNTTAPGRFGPPQISPGAPTILGSPSFAGPNGASGGAPQFTPPSSMPTPVDAQGRPASPYPSTGSPDAMAEAAGGYQAAPAVGSIGHPVPGVGNGTEVPAGLLGGSIGHPPMPRAYEATPAPPTTSDNAAMTAMAGHFAQTIDDAQKDLEANQLADALVTLSNLYTSPNLPVEYAGRITEMLDQLAGTVIYSRDHWLEPAYTVRSGDTIDTIAQQYNVPPQLLININGIRDPQNLRPGEQLKVVRGPFSAIVDLDKHELTLMLQGHYAGRFGIGVGQDIPNLEGSFVVCSQTINPAYYGPDHTQFQAGDPNNPYGGYWIGLGQQVGSQEQLGLHGTNDPTSLHSTGGRGIIRLGDRDITDIYGILSLGSRVTIVK